MKKTKIALIASILTVAVVAVGTLSCSIAYATLVPNLSLAGVSGSGSVQVTVFGADANSSVLLYYPSSSSISSVNIGTTNSSGYLTTAVNSYTYNITAGAMVYVGVNGSQSQQVAWPNYSASGGLSLSQTVLTILAGQSTVISAPVSATLSLSNDTNPSVASANISGNQVTISGLAAGTSNITICASNIGCGIVYVTVQAQSVSSTPVSLSQSTVNLTVGQGQSVSISGSGNYYISSVSNPSVVSSSINGSSLNLNALIAGTASINICAQGGNSTSCSTLTVNVSGTSVTTTSIANQQNQTLSFSQSQVTLSVGQKQTVSIYGGTTAASYYVQGNSSPSSVTANMNGASSVDLYGMASGAANINICQLNGICGNLYAYVPGNGVVTPTAASMTAPAVASFSVSSNNSSGDFLGSGNVLTLSVTANQSISTPTITIAGTALSVSGSGNGPYTATYTLLDNRAALPVSISFNNPAGTAGQAKFTIGDNSAPVNTSGSGSISGSGFSESSANPTKITQALKLGSTGVQVTLLQKRLTALGVYSGPITGTFGAKTETAVKALQAKYKLAQLGSVGPATRAVLNNQ